MLQNSRVTALTISKLLRKTNIGEITPHPIQIRFNTNNCFVCYLRLLKFTLRKNTKMRGNREFTLVSGSIQQEKLPVSLEVARIYF